MLIPPTCPNFQDFVPISGKSEKFSRKCFKFWKNCPKNAPNMVILMKFFYFSQKNVPIFTFFHCKGGALAPKVPPLTPLSQGNKGGGYGYGGYAQLLASSSPNTSFLNCIMFDVNILGQHLFFSIATRVKLIRKVSGFDSYALICSICYLLAGKNCLSTFSQLKQIPVYTI